MEHPVYMKGLVSDAYRSCAAGYLARSITGRRYALTLLAPWADLGTAVNADIEASRPFVTRDRGVLIIAGSPEKETEEIQAIGYALEVRSNRRLTLVHILDDHWPLPDLTRPPFSYAWLAYQDERDRVSAE